MPKKMEENKISKNLENIEYIKIDKYSSVSLIEVENLDEFLKLIEKFEPELIYINIYQHNVEIKKAPVKCPYCESKYIEQLEYEDNYECNSCHSGFNNIQVVEKTLNDFLFYHNNVTYCKNGWNYNTILDLIDGTSKGFQYGDEYYKAMKTGFSNYKEYSECKDLGYKTKSDYVKSKKLGFRGCYNKIKSLIHKSYYKDKENFYCSEEEYYNITEAEIYHHAKKLGYKNFEEFNDGLTKGFKNAKEYRKATSMGFVSESQYYKALERGFKNPKEFDEAEELNIKTKEAYDEYKELEVIKKERDFETIEEAHLYQIISNLKLDEKLHIDKLWERLEGEQEKYEYKDELYYDYPKLSVSYTKKFECTDDMIEFLSNNKNIPNDGFYYSEEEVFERAIPIKFSKEIIVVDGSNVAWNKGDHEKGDKPYAKNIELVVDELKKKGFKKIIVFVDANLRHCIDDKDIFEKLEKEKILKEVPGKTDADEFIIKYAKEKTVKVITNDRFSDWKEKDKWTKDRIDKYLIKFMIEDDVVKLYGLKEVKNDG